MSVNRERSLGKHLLILLIAVLAAVNASAEEKLIHYTIGGDAKFDVYYAQSSPFRGHPGQGPVVVLTTAVDSARLLSRRNKDKKTLEKISNFIDANVCVGLIEKSIKDRSEKSDLKLVSSIKSKPNFKLTVNIDSCGFKASSSMDGYLDSYVLGSYSLMKSTTSELVVEEQVNLQGKEPVALDALESGDPIALEALDTVLKKAGRRIASRIIYRGIR